MLSQILKKVNCDFLSPAMRRNYKLNKLKIGLIVVYLTGPEDQISWSLSTYVHICKVICSDLN